MRQKKCKGYIPEEILNERHDPKVFNEAMNRLLHVDKRKQEYEHLIDRQKKARTKSCLSCYFMTSGKLSNSSSTAYIQPFSASQIKALTRLSIGTKLYFSPAYS